MSQGNGAAVNVDNLRIQIQVFQACNRLRGKGIKGAVGTSATFVDMLADSPVSAEMLKATAMKSLGISAHSVATQVYPRSQDYSLMAGLAGATGQNGVSVPGLVAEFRKPEIMADAAHAILRRDAAACTGHFFIDEDVLRAEGVTDFSVYGPASGQKPLMDFFIPDEVAERYADEVSNMFDAR